MTPQKRPLILNELAVLYLNLIIIKPLRIADEGGIHEIVIVFALAEIGSYL